ncbi:hypothetical protein [Rhizobium ruizarguesonis]|uniref:hypothetical protein n=1 Tax=Rhizobium ruizarguesonis TaxID=2081791 RepID=UPI001030D150|nr:hypothetical protein [Rhizobium ruizarguesonis]TBC84263.1 hypothetical protein ELH28_16500 [Rhizobium ruizarguesonis]
MELSVAERLAAMVERYEEWVREGVPAGVDFKTSLTQAHNWSCPEYGIFAVASKRDWNTNSKEHGKIVTKIGKLLKRLRPYDVVQREKGLDDVEGGKEGSSRRVYKTQKARRISAEDEASLVTGMLEATTKKYHELSYKLQRSETDCQFLKVQNLELQKNNDALAAENARLKRLLAPASGLQLVD